MDLVVDVLLALLFAVGLFGLLWAAGLVLSPSGTSPGDLRGIGDALVEAADPRRLGVALAVCIAAFAAIGWTVLIEDVDLPAFVPNKEGTVPTYLSSGLLLAAGALSILVGADDRPDRQWWLLWGIVLLGLGLDEGAEVHERLEVRSGLPAPVVLGPVGIVAAIAYLKIFNVMPPGSAARRLFVGGAAAWATALLSDVVHGVDWKSVAEETLEMSGSAMILLALLLMVRAR